jgi:diguanylate cyclase (GGDEF)-like protein
MVVLVLGVGLAASAVTRSTLEVWAESTVDRRFLELAEPAVAELERAFTAHVEAIELLAVFAGSHDQVEPDLLAWYVESSAVLRDGASHAIGFVRRNGEGRAELVATVRDGDAAAVDGFDLDRFPTLRTAFAEAAATGEPVVVDFAEVVEAVDPAGPHGGTDGGRAASTLADRLSLGSPAPGAQEVELFPRALVAPVPAHQGGPAAAWLIAGILPRGELLRIAAGRGPEMDIVVRTPDDPPAYSSQGRLYSAGATVVGIPWVIDVAATRSFGSNGEDSVADLGAFSVLACAMVAAGSLVVRNRHVRRAAEALRRLDEVSIQVGQDPLTGVANRAGLEAALAELAGSGGNDAAVLFVDLDGMKPVNDRFGHATGDRLLVHVAQTLVSAVRSGDVVARVGGDEFVVVCPGVTRPAVADRIASVLLDVLSIPVRDRSGELEVTASIGVALGTVGPRRPGVQLLSAADTAMYAAKTAGGGRVAHAGDEPTAKDRRIRLSRS